MASINGICIKNIKYSKDDNNGIKSYIIFGKGEDILGTRVSGVHGEDPEYDFDISILQDVVDKLKGTKYVYGTRPEEVNINTLIDLLFSLEDSETFYKRCFPDKTTTVEACDKSGKPIAGYGTWEKDPIGTPAYEDFLFKYIKSQEVNEYTINIYKSLDDFNIRV